MKQVDAAGRFLAQLDARLVLAPHAVKGARPFGCGQGGQRSRAGAVEACSAIASTSRSGAIDSMSRPSALSAHTATATSGPL
ncbi:hypothetical protein LP420_37205 [Massilia sp. B-10]|nr:hypothetical protein LP420_37205 [Massilia sp. B-10]